MFFHTGYLQTMLWIKKLMCASELPYFEGDFWPNILENEISKLDRNIQSNICLTMEKMESSSMTIE